MSGFQRLDLGLIHAGPGGTGMQGHELQGTPRSPGGAVLWTPDVLTLAGWWDASDTGTVTLNSGRVSSWASKEGSIDLDQATAANQPAYTSGQYVNFDTSARYLSPSSTWPSVYDFYIVAQPIAAGGYRTLLWSAANNHPALLQTGNTNFGKWDGNFDIYTGLTFPNQDGLALVRAELGGNMSANRDGGAIATAGGTVNAVAAHVGGGNVGQHWGRLYEAVLVGSALSDTDREKMEGYLAHKWSLTGLLDAGHPYKSSAPTV